MKFLERAFLLMYLIGLFFSFVQKPPDHSLLFISSFLFTTLYILCMPFLLKGVTMRELTQKEKRQGFKWHQVLSGILFGILSSYVVFAITYHLLGKMDSLALAENCGIFLVLFAVYSLLSIKKSRSPFYKTMLIRTAIQALIITASLLIKGL